MEKKTQKSRGGLYRGIRMSSISADIIVGVLAIALLGLIIAAVLGA